MGVGDRLPLRRGHVQSGGGTGAHLTVLQWARANGCDWDELTCIRAVSGGHMAMLQWAWANCHDGCDWNANTCSLAAHGGHLEVLQWVTANALCRS